MPFFQVSSDGGWRDCFVWGRPFLPVLPYPPLAFFLPRPPFFTFRLGDIQRFTRRAALTTNNYARHTRRAGAREAAAPTPTKRTRRRPANSNRPCLSLRVVSKWPRAGAVELGFCRYGPKKALFLGIQPQSPQQSPSVFVQSAGASTITPTITPTITQGLPGIAG